MEGKNEGMKKTLPSVLMAMVANKVSSGTDRMDGMGESPGGVECGGMGALEWVPKILPRKGYSMRVSGRSAYWCSKRYS